MSIKGKQRDHELLSDHGSPMGARLRQAREASGLDLAAAAERLHLSRAMVTALEEENFDVLPARVFVRGYYRNYARLVGFPEETVLQDFEKRCPEGSQCSEAPPVLSHSVRKEIRSNHGLVRLTSWGIALALLASVGWWWKTNLHQNDAATTEADTQLEVTKAVVPPVENNAQTENAQTEPETEAAESAVEVAFRKPPPAKVEQPAAAPLTEQQEKTAAAQEAGANAGAVSQAVLQFTGDCWIDVRDSRRRFKVAGKRRAGDRILLEGTPPYKMILGNVSGVRLLLNGQPYDLSPFTKGNVAKFTFDPENP